MFAKHFTVFLDFSSYLSLTGRIQTHTRIAKFFLISLILFGLVGVFFAVMAAYGKLVLFSDLTTQISTAKNIALYNLMTIILLPAVTETKITLPSGEPVKIRSWFHQSSALRLKPATVQGFLYVFTIGFLTLLPSLGLIWNLAAGEFAAVDLLAIPLFCLGVMMYVHALQQSKADKIFNKPDP